MFIDSAFYPVVVFIFISLLIVANKVLPKKIKKYKDLGLRKHVKVLTVLLRITQFLYTINTLTLYKLIEILVDKFIS